MPGALPFAVGSLFAALWVVASFFEYAAIEVETKVFWVKVQAAMQLPASTAITCFALEYTWPGRWLNRRNLILLTIAPVLLLVLIITNDLHHLLWSGLTNVGTVTTPSGSVIWLFVFYAMLLGIVELIVFCWLFWHSPPHRWPVAIMVSAQIMARVVYPLSLSGTVQTDIPLDVIVVAFLFISYAFALFAFNLFDPIPLASETVIEQLEEGILVLDPLGRVAKVNVAARTILGIPTHSNLGQPVGELLPDYSSERSDPIEINLKSGSLWRDYILENSVLMDWRGLEVGRLLLLRDMTEQKRTQAKFVEQQRALAMLHEREHLARELHDSVGQVLGYAGFQLEAASSLMLDGQIEVANRQIKRLGDIVCEAHADVREQILDLRKGPVGQKPFFAALNDYLEGYTSNYDIQTQLRVDETINEESLPPDGQMQLFRIVQEVLTNTRKHSQARFVSIAFRGDSSLLRLIIEDDGIGFDSSKLPVTGQAHFGLRFIRERAEALGGRLLIEAVPELGTRVVVEVPAKES